MSGYPLKVASTIEGGLGMRRCSWPASLVIPSKNLSKIHCEESAIRETGRSAQGRFQFCRIIVGYCIDEPVMQQLQRCAAESLRDGARTSRPAANRRRVNL